jgi:hypothetical protein
MQLSRLKYLATTQDKEIILTEAEKEEGWSVVDGVVKIPPHYNKDASRRDLEGDNFSA